MIHRILRFLDIRREPPNLRFFNR